MYPRNAASPERISIGPVVLIADGTVQTSGVTVRIIPFGGAEADGAGTTAYSTDGVVLYTPTQAETNYTSFVLIAKKSACIPANVTVVTSASSLAGHAGTDQSKITNATSTVNLSNTTIKNATDNATQTSVDTVASYIDTEVAAIKAKTDNLPSDPADASDIATSFGTINSTLSTIASYVDTEVAAIKAKTDLIAAFPANFSAMVINGGNGHVAVVVHAVQAGAYTDAAFSPNWFTAAGLAADAANEIATAVSGIQVISRLDSMLEDNGSGQFRFDTIALEMAPGGAGAGGTDWTANERTAIRAILGVPTSGTTPTDPTTGILDTIRDSVGAIGINVYPVSASTPERVAGTTITYYRNEIRTVSVVTDFTLTSLTLTFTVEDSEGADLLTIANASISRSDKTFTVSIGTAVTATISNYRWALRDITGGTNSVIARGVLTVQEAASA